MSVNTIIEEAKKESSQSATTPVPLSYFNSDSGKQPMTSFIKPSTVPIPSSHLSQSSTQSQSLPNHIRTRDPSTKREEFNSGKTPDSKF